MFTAFSLVCAWVIGRSTDELVAGYILDDALYYLRIAQHIVAGDGQTFDGITLTNGTQPLWQWVCVLFTAIIGHDAHDALLYTSEIAQAGFMLAGLYLLLRLLTRLGASKPAALAVVGATFAITFDLLLSGMESALLLFVLTGTLALCVNRRLLDRADVRANIGLGLLLTALFLCRLDNAAIVVALLIGLALRTGMWAAVRAGLVFTALAGPYLLTNLVWFGAFVPISGLKKHLVTAGADDDLLAGPVVVLAQRLGIPGALAATGLVGLLLLAVWAARRPGAIRVAVDRLRLGGALPWFALGVIGRAAHLSFYIDEYRDVAWYWIPDVVLAAALAATALTMLLDRITSKPALHTGLAWFVAVAAPATALHLDLKEQAMPWHADTRQVVRAGHWLREHTPQNSRLAMYDAGRIAWIARRDAVALSGLVTDKAHMERLIGPFGQVTDVMDDLQVDYYVTSAVVEGETPAPIVVWSGPPNEAPPRGFHYVVIHWSEHSRAARHLIRAWWRLGQDAGQQ